MPAIVLRISFKRVLGSKWADKELTWVISEKLQALDSGLFFQGVLQALVLW
jgi:hypothetical protein